MYFNKLPHKSSTTKKGQNCNNNYKINSLYFQKVRSYHVIVITMTSLVLIRFIIIFIKNCCLLSNVLLCCSVIYIYISVHATMR